MQSNQKHICPNILCYNLWVLGATSCIQKAPTLSCHPSCKDTKFFVLFCVFPLWKRECVSLFYVHILEVDLKSSFDTLLNVCCWGLHGFKLVHNFKLSAHHTIKSPKNLLTNAEPWSYCRPIISVSEHWGFVKLSGDANMDPGWEIPMWKELSLLRLLKTFERTV